MSIMKKFLRKLKRFFIGKPTKMDLWYAGVKENKRPPRPRRYQCRQCGKDTEDLKLAYVENTPSKQIQVLSCPECRQRNQASIAINDMIKGMVQEVQEYAAPKQPAFHKGDKLRTRWESDKWRAGQTFTAEWNSYWEKNNEFVRLVDFCPGIPFYTCQFELVKTLSLEEFVGLFKKAAPKFDWRQAGWVIDGKQIWLEKSSNPNCLRGYWKDKEIDFSVSYDPAEAVCKACFGYDKALVTNVREKLNMSKEDYEKLFHAMNSPIEYCDAMLKSDLFVAAGKI